MVIRKEEGREIHISPFPLDILTEEEMKEVVNGKHYGQFMVVERKDDKIIKTFIDKL